jgi:hypothetical protein
MRRVYSVVNGVVSFSDVPKFVQYVAKKKVAADVATKRRACQPTARR